MSRKISNRSIYEPNDKLITDPVMRHMREVAFGHETSRHTQKVLDKAIRMRDDDDMLSRAEEKRLRKLAKRQKYEL